MRTRQIDHRIRRLDPALRRDLLLVLQAPSSVRADVIRQLHERSLPMAEALMDAEEDDDARAALILALERSLLADRH